MILSTHDLAIVGGGPAGMAAALVAGRCRLDAVVINEENPRNRVTIASHGFLTRDGVHPLELLQVAKSQLQKYPSVIYYTDQVIAALEEDDGGFRIQRAVGPEIHAQRVIIAAGNRDDLDSLRLPGIHDVYGKSVYPCPFCDGFEHSDERIAVFGAEGVERHVPIIKMWSDDVHVFTNGRTLSTQAKQELDRNSVSVHEGRVRRLVSQDGRLVEVQLENESIERDAGFLWDKAGVPSNTLADDLGVPRNMNPWGIVTYQADEFGRTSVPGVYVVGDLRSGFSRLTVAAAEGGRCVEHIVHEISMEMCR
ncbi:NAD(P)/FAD-dependent oxidoreductase [Nitrososphaera viennensis]|uniref:Thioredoxin reductase n=2 Tax=Nitrososphaera viennensis TaxID=1034015 RepID=A0A060HJS6_9ARCH|nr:NAD(P)/FAD-dependent oxidoreductase [Nitrososphaera viennensis]AIC15520.1 Thioredoxin reductase [Nitrososphaera viennensis EN76]UVS70406.1 NAD(P)/FAD-dependent oxidoreductase [Nitrososphaera viennensis]